MSGHLLLVEDEPDIQLIARAALRRAGFDVRTASNGREALAAVGESRPDAILMDCMMPELDGLAACAQLKSDAATRDIPIVFLTARADAAAHARCLAVGALGCIAKPFNPLCLGDEVRAMLAEHAAECSGPSA
jgi:two-component system phosphate regulon response regulator PhoB